MENENKGAKALAVVSLILSLTGSLYLIIGILQIATYGFILAVLLGGFRGKMIMALIIDAIAIVLSRVSLSRVDTKMATWAKWLSETGLLFMVLGYIYFRIKS